MSDTTVVHDTFVIERIYAAAPARVFAAFADPVKKRRWFAEGDGFDIDEYTLDFRVGGSERTRFRFEMPGRPGKTSGVNDTVFTDIVENRRIVFAYAMTIAGQRISSSQTTFELVPDGAGTTLVMTEQAAFFDGADGAERREGGWRELLDSLGRALDADRE
ncbi:MAG TPA: SRPBCC domain-containing protein [Tahibacter sp.]|nr:SRPBCC domain-containing protein [Tahibacter sp.]